MNREEEIQECFRQIQALHPLPVVTKLEENQKGIYFILGYLLEHDSTVTAGDLARESCVSSARIARLLNNLEQKGFVCREQSKEDARKTIVHLTESGREEATRCRAEFLQMIAYLYDEIGAEDLKTLLRICFKVKEKLNEEGKMSCCNV